MSNKSNLPFKQLSPLFVIVLLLVLPTFSFASLVDSYDFEDLFVGTDASNFSKESSHKINCTDTGDFPSCTAITAGAGDGDAKVTIENDVTRGNYLTVSAVGGKIGSYRASDVELQMDNLTVLTNITIQYKLKLNTHYTGEALIGTQSRNDMGGIWFTNFIPVAGDKQVLMSGGTDYSLDAGSFTGLRGYYDFNKMTPENSSCEINNGYWNTITSQYYFNGTEHYLYNKIYVNGILCDYQEYNTDYAPTNNYLLNRLRFFAQAGFNVSFDDIYIYDELINPLVTTISETDYCPLPNCIFYDNFNRLDYSDLSLAGYSEYTDSAYNINKTLTIDSFASPNLIYHDFEDNDYTKILAGYEFIFNKTTTPDTMEDEYIVYRITTYCDNDFFQPLTSANLYFLKDTDFSESENRTIVNLYFNSDYEQAPTNIPSNDERYYLFLIFDIETQKVMASYTWGSFDFPQLSIFSTDFNAPCYNINGVSIQRIDNDNPVNLDFVLLDKIYYYSPESETGIEDYPFVYSNETLDNESIISGDFGEYLQNTATVLGFKSSMSRILFWYLLVGLFVVGIMQLKEIEGTTKNFVISLVVVVSHVLGWKLGFIPVQFLVFIILALASILAITFYKVFASDSQ